MALPRPWLPRRCAGRSPGYLPPKDPHAVPALGQSIPQGLCLPLGIEVLQASLGRVSLLSL